MKFRLIAAAVLALVLGALFVLKGGLDGSQSDGATEQAAPVSPDPDNNPPATPGKKFNL